MTRCVVFYRARAVVSSDGVVKSSRTSYTELVNAQINKIEFKS